jgi:hypothetical protein
MNYFLGLFSPATWTGFRRNGGSVMGFPKSMIRRAREVEIGDYVIGYLSGLSRWCGVFRISGEMYKDNTPLFVPEKDKFILRFPIHPLVVLEPKESLPIELFWDRLERTRHIVKARVGWAAQARLLRSLDYIDPNDGKILFAALSERLDNIQCITGRVG